MGPYSVVIHMTQNGRVYLKVTKFILFSLQINTQKGLNKIVTLVLAHIVFVLSYHVSG